MVALILWLFRRRQKKEVLTVSSSMSSQPQQHANNQHAQHDAAVDGLYGVCQRIEAAIVASNGMACTFLFIFFPSSPP